MARAAGRVVEPLPGALDVRLLDWWSHTPQDGPPAEWGDPSLYEYHSSTGMWYCRLCWKYANEAHVHSRRHAENVRCHVDITLPAPLAPPAHGPWCAQWCFAHERPFYYQSGTEQSSWDLPAAHLLEPAPAGGIPGDPRARWGVSRSAQCQLPYFWNPDTRDTRWAPRAAVVGLCDAHILPAAPARVQSDVADGGGAAGAARAPALG